MLLSVERLSGRYGAVAALERVDLQVDRGEMVALLGRNGAGKTTLLRCIAGLHRPSSGRVLFDGEDLGAMPAAGRVRRGLSLVPEGGGLFPALTVAENLVVAAPDARTERERIAEVTARLPLVGTLLRRTAGTLSGGERRQVAMARALMSRPRLLLVDELSLGLAPRALGAFVDVLRSVNASGTAILLVEQRVDVALRLASRGVVLEGGVVTLAGSGTELASAGDALRRAYLGSATPAGRAAGDGSPGADAVDEERLSLPIANRTRRGLQEAADAAGVTAGAYVAGLVEKHLVERARSADQAKAAT
jgi:branched-chain amino acid transport system ATP-binding protein